MVTVQILIAGGAFQAQECRFDPWSSGNQSRSVIKWSWVLFLLPLNVSHDNLPFQNLFSVGTLRKTLQEKNLCFLL